MTEWAAGLIAMGVQLEDRVAIASTTRVEWILADLAIICAGGATTTVYPTTIAEDVAYILTDSGSSIVFAENAEQVAKLQAVRSEIPGVQHVIALTGEGSEDGWVITTDDLAAKGREWLSATPDLVHSRIDQLGPESLAVVIYTSGTTGRPKGVRLVQDSVVYEGAVIEAMGTLTRTSCRSSGCRSRTSSARCSSPPACRSASRPPSTGASRRSSTTWPSSSPPSWPDRRASSRRLTAASR